MKMFYALANQFIKSNNPRAQSFKVFLTGSICYIIVHALLFSKNRGELIQKYRHYLYYVYAADCGLTMARMTMQLKKQVETNVEEAKEEHMNKEKKKQMDELPRCENGVCELQNPSEAPSEKLTDLFIKEMKPEVNDDETLIPLYIPP